MANKLLSSHFGVGFLITIVTENNVFLTLSIFYWLVRIFYELIKRGFFKKEKQ
jgi:hypothetical protein